MIYILLSIVAGIATGFLSLKFEKAFVAFFFALPVALLFVVKIFTPFARMVESTVEGGGILSVYAAVFNLLPEDLQMCVFVFPAVAIIARLGGWIYIKSKGPAQGETNAERKARILKEYGYEDGMPY